MRRVVQTAALIGFVSWSLSGEQSRVAAQSRPTSDLPWMNTALTPEQRADLLIPQMTLEQKVEQISNDTRPAQDPENRPPGCEFTDIARHIQGISELGIP